MFHLVQPLCRFSATKFARPSTDIKNRNWYDRWMVLFLIHICVLLKIANESPDSHWTCGPVGGSKFVWKMWKDRGMIFRKNFKIISCFHLLYNLEWQERTSLHKPKHTAVSTTFIFSSFCSLSVGISLCDMFHAKWRMTCGMWR